MNDALLSTTSTLSRIRGFTLELLFLLKDECLTSTEISQKTGKSGNYVRCYLYNMRKYGLVDKELCFWKITILGRKIIEHYIKVNNIIIESKRKQKKSKRRVKESKRWIRKKEDLLCAETSIKACRRQTRQIQIEPFLRNCNLDDIEKAVVEVLIKHYNKTGSKFIMVKDQYELAERLNANPSDLPNALKNLRQDGIIYIFRDKTFNCWKIGLKKAFLEVLQDRRLGKL